MSNTGNSKLWNIYKDERFIAEEATTDELLSIVGLKLKQLYNLNARGIKFCNGYRFEEVENRDKVIANQKWFEDFTNEWDRVRFALNPNAKKVSSDEVSA